MAVSVVGFAGAHNGIDSNLTQRAGIRPARDGGETAHRAGRNQLTGLLDIVPVGIDEESDLTVRRPRRKHLIVPKQHGIGYDAVLVRGNHYEIGGGSRYQRARRALDHETASDTTFNSVLLNRYRDGSDRVAWHSDDEKE